MSFSSDARVVLRCAVRAFGTMSCGSSSSCDGAAAGGCCDARRELRRVAGCGGGGAAGCAGGGDGARFLLADFAVLEDVVFFGRAGAGAGSGSSFSGSAAAAVLARFAPRVKTKSPSCSSYATIRVSVRPAVPVAPHAAVGARSNAPARRLLFRRCGSLPILKTCKGWRVRTRVVMDERCQSGITTSIRPCRVLAADRLASWPGWSTVAVHVARWKIGCGFEGARARRVKLVMKGEGA